MNNVTKPFKEGFIGSFMLVAAIAVAVVGVFSAFINGSPRDALNAAKDVHHSA